MRTRGWRAGTTACRNAEDPRKPQDPYPRVKALRETMREQGIADSVPIVMAGGVWRLDEWENWIDNPELGQIVFQFGTRPLLTQESPIPPEWKARLMTLEEGDVLLHRFSPTGFYSSAVRNPFLRNLEARSERQIAYTKESIGDHHFQLDVGIGTKKNYWVTKGDLIHAREWYARGFTNAMKTPDDTLIFVTPEEEKQIRVDQAECMGCLSQCGFSSWADNEKNSTGRLADPRSFCIQKTLQEIAHGGPVEQNLMFAGHAAFRFKSDPFYSNGFIPTVKQLVDRILTGRLMRAKAGRAYRTADRCGDAGGACRRAGQAAALLGVDRERPGDDPHRARARIIPVSGSTSAATCRSGWSRNMRIGGWSRIRTTRRAGCW